MDRFFLSENIGGRLRMVAGLPGEYLYVNTRDQVLTHVVGDTPRLRYPVSTSRYGIGSRENSFMTPPGIHRIAEKIGAGAPVGRIFRDRKDTGRDCEPSCDGENLILTRILRLEGIEWGINRGPGIDSYERFIYLHGTNRESDIGTPVSHGCVCMRNADIVDLFDRVKEGTIVVID